MLLSSLLVCNSFLFTSYSLLSLFSLLPLLLCVHNGAFCFVGGRWGVVSQSHPTPAHSRRRQCFFVCSSSFCFLASPSFPLLCSLSSVSTLLVILHSFPLLLFESKLVVLFCLHSVGPCRHEYLSPSQQPLLVQCVFVRTCLRVSSFCIAIIAGWLPVCVSSAHTGRDHGYYIPPYLLVSCTSELSHS